MTLPLRFRLLVGVAAGLLLSAAWPVRAQTDPTPAAPAAAASAVSGFLQNLFSPLQAVLPGASAPTPTTAAPAPAGGALTTALAPLQPNSEALRELAVDPECRRVEENFDVWGKALQYAGTNAQLRLRQLMATDFQHDQLTPADKQFMKYLAYTTVWVPASVETTIGKAYAVVSNSSGGSTATGDGIKGALGRIDQRMQALKGQIDGFPGGVELVYDDKLRDGAFARVGGLVMVSERFVGLMDESDAVRDMVLAHELSHLYKRHTLKEMQYQLLTSAAGYSVAKKLVGRLDPQRGFSVMPDLLFYAQVGQELISWVRNNQLTYSKDQELEADGCSMAWLDKVKVDRMEAWRAFGLALAPQPGQAAGYESLHPSPAERTANIQRALSRKPAAPAPAPKAKPKS